MNSSDLFRVMCRTYITLPFQCNYCIMAWKCHSVDVCMLDYYISELQCTVCDHVK